MHYDLFYENTYFATFDNIRVVIEDGNTVEHSFSVPDQLDEGDWEMTPAHEFKVKMKHFMFISDFILNPMNRCSRLRKNEAIFDHDHDGQDITTI